MSQTPPSQALSLDGALVAARRAIASIDNGHELVLLEDRTLERDFGWVFSYTTRQYRDTGDRRFLVPGTGPLVVERDGGHVSFLSTSVPPDRAIAVFEKTWRERVGSKGP